MKLIHHHHHHYYYYYYYYYYHCYYYNFVNDVHFFCSAFCYGWMVFTISNTSNVDFHV